MNGSSSASHTCFKQQSWGPAAECCLATFGSQLFYCGLYSLLQRLLCQLKLFVSWMSIYMHEWSTCNSVACCQRRALLACLALAAHDRLVKTQNQAQLTQGSTSE